MAKKKVSKVETWAEQQEREGREAIDALKRVIPVLRRLGIENVTAGYEGSGDSGAIEYITYEPEPPAGIPEGLEEIIDNAVCSLLPPGWENNEGASGTVTLDVVSGTMQREHNWNVIVTECEESELDLELLPDDR